MSGIRSFKPTVRRSAGRRAQYDLGQIGVNGKRSPRAKRRDEMVRTVMRGEPYACPSCGAQAEAARDGKREDDPVRIALEHEPGCRLLDSRKPRDFDPDVSKALDADLAAKMREPRKRQPRTPPDSWGTKTPPRPPAPTVSETRDLTARHPALADLEQDLRALGLPADEVRRRIRTAVGTV